jgi:hypothetical protein
MPDFSWLHAQDLESAREASRRSRASESIYARSMSGSRRRLKRVEAPGGRLAAATGKPAWCDGIRRQDASGRQMLYHKPKLALFHCGFAQSLSRLSSVRMLWPISEDGKLF